VYASDSSRVHVLFSNSGSATKAAGARNTRLFYGMIAVFR
jgi:hypothetical protein